MSTWRGGGRERGREGGRGEAETEIKRQWHPHLCLSYQRWKVRGSDNITCSVFRRRRWDRDEWARCSPCKAFWVLESNVWILSLYSYSSSVFPDFSDLVPDLRAVLRSCFMLIGSFLIIWNSWWLWGWDLTLESSQRADWLPSKVRFYLFNPQRASQSAQPTTPSVLKAVFRYINSTVIPTEGFTFSFILVHLICKLCTSRVLLLPPLPFSQVTLVVLPLLLRSQDGDCYGWEASVIPHSKSWFLYRAAGISEDLRPKIED